MTKYGVFLKPTTLDRMVVVKTTVDDPADSDWDSQDGEVDFSGVAVKSLWYVESGSDIHIATQQEDGRIAYHVFDPGTDAWTIKDEEVAIVGQNSVYDTLGPEFLVTIALRGDGDVIIGYNTRNDTPFDGATYSRKESGTWSDPIQIQVGALNKVTAVGPDGSDRITFNLAAPGSWRTKSLSSTNAFGALVTVDSITDLATFIVGPGVIDSNDKIYVPYIETGDQISTAFWTSDVVPSINTDDSIGDNTVYGHGRTSAPFIAACLAVDGTDVHLLYADDSTQDLFHDNDVDGGGATDNEELDAVTVNRISCKMGITDLLYFYDDGGTTKFGSIEVAAVLTPAEIITMLNRDKISPIRQM